MTTLYQMQRLVAMKDLGWYGVGVPDEAWPQGEQPVGGVATVMNRDGDVAKVYGDGRAVVLRGQAWDQGQTATELFPSLVDDAPVTERSS